MAETEKEDAQSDGRNRHEFKVTLSGITLDEVAVTRINIAIQHALLSELSSLGLEGKDFTYTPIMSHMISTDKLALAHRSSEGGGGGSSGGAWVGPPEK